MQRIDQAQLVVPSALRKQRGTVFTELTRTIQSSAKTYDQLIGSERVVPQEFKERLDNEIELYEKYCKAIKKHTQLQESEFANPHSRSTETSVVKHMVDIIRKFPV